MIERTLFSAEHEAFRDSFRRFMDKEIAPHHEAWEEQGYVDRAVWDKAGANGFLCATLPEAYGGSGADKLYSVIQMEELARGGYTGIGYGLHSEIVAPYVLHYGTEEQKQRYLPKLANGEMVGAIAMSEPAAGSDLQGIKSTAIKQADGGYVLNGNKTFITNGHYADVAVVIASTDKSKGTHGLSAFAVEKGTKGFRAGKKENKLGLRASDTSELIFEDCEIPEENLIGVEGEGFVDAMRVLDGGRISIAALALGIGRGALDAALRYVKERRQFGKSIAEFQGIQWKLADMATELDAARLLTQRAAVLKDAGRKVTRESSMAKLFSSEVAVRICDDAVQLFGGYGFIKDYPAEKYYRDVKLCTIGEGTSEIQRMVIAREILKVHPSRG
jgi:alkylation response protein AidB-like acyl-CoA dehydrogenase